MSERELARQLIDRVPEEKLGYVIGYLQGLQTLETDDDAFCERLYQQYLADDDPELIGIVYAGSIPFILLKGEDEDGEYLYVETCTNGYVIEFDVYVVDADFDQYAIKDKYIEQFKSILATFLPVT